MAWCPSGVRLNAIATVALVVHQLCVEKHSPMLVLLSESHNVSIPLFTYAGQLNVTYCYYIFQGMYTQVMSAWPPRVRALKV